ncbi:MAG: hypothetical protein JWS11_2766 [Cypionkella sp.]|nr:hypothetical protein [Cypionkella sp.]
MITMIGGVITVVGLLVTRMPHLGGAAPAVPAGLQMPANLKLPANLQLPDGAKAQAVTFGAGWIGVVTTDNRLFIFTSQGSLQQEIAIAPLPLPKL